MTEPSPPPSSPARRAIPVQVAPPAAPARRPQVHGPWRPSTLLASPHRLGFFLAALVLVVASLWWLAVQVDRATGALGIVSAVPSTLTHATVMVFGFMPLYFSGFLFTAGPKWLNVQPYETIQLRVPLLLQAVGWVLWLCGAHAHAVLALAGLAMAVAGLAWMVGMFWRLIRASRAPDQVHGRTVGVAGVVGALSLAAVAICVWLGRVDLALVWVRTGLWGFIVVTYVAVAHRMIPFFTSSVLPMIEVWRPLWVLRLMLGVAAFEVTAVWVDTLAPAPHAWPLWTGVVIVFELVTGAVLLWLAVVWGLVQSLKIRLLAMLHVGFVWFGLALVYSALSQLVWLLTGEALLGLGAVHALSMGFLGSLMLAMVTRVSCGHGGRALTADDLVWVLFWALQVTVLLRLAAAVQGAPTWLTPLAALAWAGVVTAWALRYANWYGRPRTDGRPG
ncbi:NnrS family protein [Ottowia sp. GY511]|uniref:NnrS family protein n=1 Tax=Ottowia flava TaxID=2675430 RepID=A0ABW4KN04_9BURK|nr:NnrS family protein [Ottowia sp. GY511]TXK29698.1 NnrS family protein [Ottowia sp. GY511]